MDKDKKERLESKGWKVGTAKEFLTPKPIQELCFVKPSQWIRAYDGLWTRRRQSRDRCHRCGWNVNARKVEVQIVPTDDDWKALGMEGCSISYVPFKGELEIHWCPNCRRVIATALDSDRKDSLYDDREEGYGKSLNLPTLTHSETYDKLKEEYEQLVKGLDATTQTSVISQKWCNELIAFMRNIIDTHDYQLEDRECKCEFCEKARKLIVFPFLRKEPEDGKDI